MGEIWVTLVCGILALLGNCLLTRYLTYPLIKVEKKAEGSVRETPSQNQPVGSSLLPCKSWNAQVDENKKWKKSAVGAIFIISGIVLILGGSALEILYGWYSPDGAENWIIGIMTLLFPIINIVYYFIYANRYTDLAFTKFPWKQPMGGIQSQVQDINKKCREIAQDQQNPRIFADLFKRNLQFGIGWLLALVPIFVFTLYCFILFVPAEWQLLIIPIIIILIGLMFTIYHSDGEEKPADLDRDDTAKKASAGWFLTLYAGGVSLAIAILISTNIFDATALSIGIGTIALTIGLVGLVKHKRNNNKIPKVTLDFCESINFDSDACSVLKDDICKNDPMNDICF